MCASNFGNELTPLGSGESNFIKENTHRNDCIIQLLAPKK